MNDPFLVATGVSNEQGAMTNAILSAFGRNRIYEGAVPDHVRSRLRQSLSEFLRERSRYYAQRVDDEEHCAAIREISDSVSQKFGQHLVKGRFRYGTAQKALNLYLKFLWRLGAIGTPPHCPVDSIVLAAGKIDGAWTKSDSEKEYRFWIERLRWQARPLSLAEWEYGVWQDGAGHSAKCAAT